MYVTVLEGLPFEIAAVPCASPQGYRSIGTSSSYSSALLQPNIQAHVSHSLQNLRTQSPAGIPTCPCMLKYRASSFLNYLPVLYAAISWQPIVVPYGAILSRPIISRSSRSNYSSQFSPLAHTYLSAPPRSPIERYRSADSS